MTNLCHEDSLLYVYVILPTAHKALGRWLHRVWDDLPTQQTWRLQFQGMCVCVCVGGGGGQRVNIHVLVHVASSPPWENWSLGTRVRAICHMPLTQPTCNATLAFSMSSATLSSSFSRSESVVLASTYWLFHFYRNSHKYCYWNILIIGMVRKQYCKLYQL